MCLTALHFCKSALISATNFIFSQNLEAVILIKVKLMSRGFCGQFVSKLINLDKIRYIQEGN